ncbi:MAG: right-handed parallel beta-helix repeat-containing protein [Niabella sp.]
MKIQSFVFSVLFSIILLSTCIFCNAQVSFFVDINGSNQNIGNAKSPFQTIAYAVDKALEQGAGKEVVIELIKGKHLLQNTIVIPSEKYKLKKLTIRAYKNENVIVSGVQPLKLYWEVYKNGIYRAKLQLNKLPDCFFVNDEMMPMARYPNYDKAARVFNGTAADAISPENVRKWNNPAHGYIHSLHVGEWGGFHYEITGKKNMDTLNYIGGWQNNRPSPMHERHRFVENIFEELDTPGEWYYNQNEAYLYFYPPENLNLQKADFSVSHLTDYFHVIGNANQPIRNIHFYRIQFTQSARTFMLTKEPLLRSDWTIYRGGAILLSGTENVEIKECTFTNLGGNGVFCSNYNKNNIVADNHFYNIGASAIAFVGNADAVRSPSFRYEQFVSWDKMDFTPGPKNNDYPQYCKASGNLIHDIGRIEKQVAGVQIEMAAHITVSHNSIYRVPRAGINVGDGCWGGHIIEHNDVFETVLETGDHGAFNSWGRDRYWRPSRKLVDSMVAANPGIELLDAQATTIIRNNRFQCEHGWDIDLDDGSSNYEIYNNICLNGGLKLREGYYRKVFNNIIINNTFHPHVWFINSGDVFTRNIVTTPYAPIGITNWGKKVDDNFFLTKTALEKAQKYGVDSNSIFGNPDFVDAPSGNYQLKATSKVFQIGFKKINNDFGVTLPALRAKAEKPVFHPVRALQNETKTKELEWLGGIFKNIETLGEQSAAGLPNKNGALLTKLSSKSLLAKSKLVAGDIILKIDGQDVNNINDLLRIYQSIKWKGHTDAVVFRNQGAVIMPIVFKE